MISRRHFLSGIAASSLSSYFDLYSSEFNVSKLWGKETVSIAFGSCNRSQTEQSHWDIIQQKNPDLWVWLGDNIYADHASMDERVSLYSNLYHDKYYKNFRSKIPVVGVWDDHDYAYDNCGGSFADKELSKAAFLDFLATPKDSLVRSTSQPGIYQSFAFGKKGQKTHLILLDLRFNMDRDISEKVLLGEIQWAWFENQIRTVQSDLLIIASSLNVTSNVTGFGWEGWHEFGLERQRLYNLISEAKKPAVILSGDRHFGEIAYRPLPSGNKVYECMSSGMTHSTGIYLPHKGRIGNMVGYRNFGLLEVAWDGVGPHVKSSLCSTTSNDVYEEVVLF